MLNITPSKGVLMTQAICNSAQNDGPAGPYILPTYPQARYMVYDAIINGTRGLTFYGGHLINCMNARDRALGWNWTYWDNVLGRIVREIAPHMPLHAALVSPGTGVGLRNQQQTVAGGFSRHVNGNLWVIVANREGKRNIRISNFPTGTRPGKVYMKTRYINLANRSFTDSFQPWTVRVYRVPDHGDVTHESARSPNSRPSTKARGADDHSTTGSPSSPSRRDSTPPPAPPATAGRPQPGQTPDNAAAPPPPSATAPTHPRYKPRTRATSRPSGALPGGACFWRRITAFNGLPAAGRPA